MQSFSVYADWRTTSPVDADVLASATRSFRPEDESVCIWASDRDPCVVAVSLDVEARTLEEAAGIGRSYFDGGPLAAAVHGRLTKLVAMGDECQLVWNDSA